MNINKIGYNMVDAGAEGGADIGAECGADCGAKGRG